MFNVNRFKIRECDILTRDLSDHSPICLSLQVAMKKGNTLWKLNSHVLIDSAIVSKIKEDIKEFLEINDAGEVLPTTLWDTLKALMRGKLISITSHLKRTKGERLTDLTSSLKLKQQEDINNPNPNVKQEIRKI